MEELLVTPSGSWAYLNKNSDDYMCMYVRVCVYIFMYVWMYVCMYIYIYIYNGSMTSL
jgi:hypothetical protein